MLRGEPIPGINALGYKLQMQTKALGWEIDDLLVSGRSANDIECLRLSFIDNGFKVLVAAAAFARRFSIGSTPFGNCRRASSRFSRARFNDTSERTQG